jgi:hypothetical protein
MVVQQFVRTSHRGEVIDRTAYVAADTHRLRWASPEFNDPKVITVGDTAVAVETLRDLVEREGRPVAFVMRIAQTWVANPIRSLAAFRASGCARSCRHPRPASR